MLHLSPFSSTNSLPGNKYMPVFNGKFEYACKVGQNNLRGIFCLVVFSLKMGHGSQNTPKLMLLNQA
jgi:hypothetical protein